MEALTMNRAAELAAEIVKEFGEDYVYPADHKVMFPGSEEGSCVYVHDEKPSCLVGQILHRHGVSVAELSLWENKGAYTVACATANADDGALSYLSSLQRRQDEGQSWGTALQWTNEFYAV